MTTLVTAAFATSSQKYQQLHTDWISISFQIEAQLRRHSLVMSDVQRLGALDLVLRSMEDEFEPDNADAPQFAFTHQAFLSQLWIGSFYEIFRNLRKCACAEEVEFSDLARHLRLLRIPLEKYEIAADSKLKEPLQMQTADSPGAEIRYSEYKKNDPDKGHIMPGSVATDTGSMGWLVIDIEDDNKSFWLYRRDISDRIIDFWKSYEASTG